MQKSWVLRGYLLLHYLNFNIYICHEFMTTCLDDFFACPGQKKRKKIKEKKRGRGLKVLYILFSFKLNLCPLQVFVATDDDAAPVICFFLQEQRRLLSIRLHIVQMNDDTLFDVDPDVSWSIQAVAAEPVAVTRPRLFWL